jgi:hypothetical protein
VITLGNYQGQEIEVDPAPLVVHLAVPGYLPVSVLRSAGVGDAGTAWDIPVARQKIAVDLRFVPTSALRGARLRIASTDGGGAGAIDQVLETPAMTVMLTSGNWQVDVTSRRHQASTSLLVQPGMRPVTLELQRQRRSGGDEFGRSDVVVGVLGSTFLATALTGLGLAIAGGIKESRARRKNDDATREALLATADGGGSSSALDMIEETYPTARLHRDLGRAKNLTMAGGAVAMASLGALLAAATVGSRVKRRAAYLEMGVGALLAGGGAAWTVYAVRRQNDLLAPTAPEDRVNWSDLPTGHRFGAAVLLGLGAGLVVFPAIALIGDAAWQRRQRRRGLGMAPTFGPGRVGVALRGQF